MSFLNINNEIDMKNHILKNNYLVIFPDETIKLYKSLRDIEKDILIHSSNISKKLKKNGGDHCFCSSKGTNYIFFIKKLLNIYDFAHN
jgi:hypothetical protein